MSMGVIPVRMQRASCEVVRYALAIFKFINFCTLLIFWALCFFLMHSIHTGAPYARIGSICVHVFEQFVVLIVHNTCLVNTVV